MGNITNSLTLSLLGVSSLIVLGLELHDGKDGAAVKLLDLQKVKIMKYTSSGYLLY